MFIQGGLERTETNLIHLKLGSVWIVTSFNWLYLKPSLRFFSGDSVFFVLLKGLSVNYVTLGYFFTLALFPIPYLWGVMRTWPPFLPDTPDEYKTNVGCSQKIKRFFKPCNLFLLEIFSVKVRPLIGYTKQWWISKKKFQFVILNPNDLQSRSLIIPQTHQRDPKKYNSHKLELL